MERFIFPFLPVAGHPLRRALEDGSQTLDSSASFPHLTGHPMAPFLLIKFVYLVMQMLMESFKPLLTLNSRKYYFKTTGLQP